MYTDVLDDPKVQKLPPPLFKVWVNLLCLAGRHDGVLPSEDDIAFALRLDEEACALSIRELVIRGLLDAVDDGLKPHNWDERQFKSDTAESAAERKRTQRAREKQRGKPADVTACHSDSHSEVTPPDTDTDTEADTEQSRTEQSAPAADVVIDPEHRQVVQDILDHHDDQLDHWKREFLISIKWRPNLTQAQRNSLESIRELVEPQFGKDKPMPSVKRGTPQFEAWIGYYRKKNNGKPTFYESRDSLTVPTEYPPQEKAA